MALLAADEAARELTLRRRLNHVLGTSVASSVAIAWLILVIYQVLGPGAIRPA